MGRRDQPRGEPVVERQRFSDQTQGDQRVRVLGLHRGATWGDAHSAPGNQ